MNLKAIHKEQHILRINGQEKVYERFSDLPLNIRQQLDKNQNNVPDIVEKAKGVTVVSKGGASSHTERSIQLMILAVVIFFGIIAFLLWR